uniref:Uncharacterized protein n=1 Tax=Anguilla anguilla TaxID=7936 RepID=A0A0E9SHR3_ANGAN
MQSKLLPVGPSIHKQTQHIPNRDKGEIRKRKRQNKERKQTTNKNEK